MYEAYVEIRSQHSRGSLSNMFGGPDTYVAVQCVPKGVQRLNVLNRQLAKKRGIIILHCGEGYRKNDGSRSMLGQAIAIAEELQHQIEEKGVHPLKAKV